MKILENIKKNKKIHYILKGLKHLGNESYMDYFLKREINPLILEFEKIGNNPEKKVLLIRENGDGWGFFAEFRALLAKLVFAERFSLIPYVKWGGAFPYREKEAINGTTNAYEYYFDQPSNVLGLTVQDCYLTVAKSSHGAMIEREFKKDDYEVTEVYMETLASVFRKYIRLNSITQRKLENDIKGLLKGGGER